MKHAKSSISTLKCWRNKTMRNKIENVHMKLLCSINTPISYNILCYDKINTALFRSYVVSHGILGVCSASVQNTLNTIISAVVYSVGSVSCVFFLLRWLRLASLQVGVNKTGSRVWNFQVATDFICDAIWYGYAMPINAFLMRQNWMIGYRCSSVRNYGMRKTFRIASFIYIDGSLCRCAEQTMRMCIFYFDFNSLLLIL